MPGSNEPKAWGEAALEEYKAHRAAFLDALGAAQRTLAFGATAVGILVAGAFNVWDSSDVLPATLLFLVVIPIISALVMVQWAGQMIHLGRRSVYLRTIEREVREAYSSLPGTLFRWEDQFSERHGIRDGKWWKPDLRWPMYAAMPVFGLLAFGSVVLGAHKGFKRAPEVVGATVGVELVLILCLWVGLAWELGTHAHRGSPSDPESSSPHEQARTTAAKP